MKARGSSAGGRNGVDQVGVADLIRILVALFPDQHPRSAAWVHTLGGRLGGASASGSMDPHDAPRDGGGLLTRRLSDDPVVGGERKQADSFAEQHPLAEARKSGTRKRQQYPPVKSQRPVPSFARSLLGSPADWNGQQGGPELSWGDEQSLCLRVATSAGLTNADQGHLSGMLAVCADLTLASGSAVNVEILVPRKARPSEVLVSANIKGQPRRYFEVKLEDLSEYRIRELADFTLGAGGIS